MVYSIQQTGGRWGGRTSIAPGWAMQVGGGGEKMVDSCTTASK